MDGPLQAMDGWKTPASHGWQRKTRHSPFLLGKPLPFSGATLPETNIFRL